jgi:predicted nucleotidyltransferase
MILEETLEIVKKHIALAEIIGIYLVGSYARKEETNDSDIDLLIITSDTDQEMIVEGSYNILLVSKALLKQKLNNDL